MSINPKPLSVFFLIVPSAITSTSSKQFVVVLPDTKTAQAIPTQASIVSVGTIAEKGGGFEKHGDSLVTSACKNDDRCQQNGTLQLRARPGLNPQMTASAHLRFFNFGPSFDGGVFRCNAFNTSSISNRSAPHFVTAVYKRATRCGFLA